MDALSKLFSTLNLPVFLQTLISIGLAAIVFFYFVYLLRKEEAPEPAREEELGADVGPKMQGQA